ncbi:MAG: hypothetical protein IPH57_11475 [Saprospiraceae bacterium]|nr:hypothetical protein [Saprospiraceae bacterium]
MKNVRFQRKYAGVTGKTVKIGMEFRRYYGNFARSGKQIDGMIMPGDVVFCLGDYIDI